MAKNKKIIDINTIKYYEEDRLAILNFAKSFKDSKTPVKKNKLKRWQLKGFVKKINETVDDIIKRLEKPIPIHVSIQISQLYYKYWNSKKRFTDSKFFNVETENKLDSLINVNALIEAGKLFKLRQNLKNPFCFDIFPFLQKEDDFEEYFYGGIKQLVNISKYAYSLNAIEGAVSRRLNSENKKSPYKRMFYIHVGKTNSGKTYTSLEMLKKAKKGAYLSPLRLLALEVSDVLKNSGLKCSFITGEEERIEKDATHISSTVELAEFKDEYDVVVIDECQMISDYSRGHAWTKAIMNIKAREICLCTAPEALDVLVKLIDNCGDFYKIIRHRRKTPLVVEDNAFSLDDVKAGDALVAFSKQKVNAIGAQLIKKGIGVSVLYGALPYEARKQQFENFISGKSSVLVTTDAIGMGVNLPVRRIVFMEMYKYDGKEIRLLKSGEIKQIAGRAGRRGKFDIGYVNANGEKEREYIRKKLASKTEQVEGICLGFPKNILDDEYIDLKNVIFAWNIFKVPEPYIKESLFEASEVIDSIYDIYIRKGAEENKVEIFETASMPVDKNNIRIRSLWLKYIEQHISNKQELMKPQLRGKSVTDFLQYSKMLDTYFMCSRIWNMDYSDKWLVKQRKLCNEALIDGLIEDVKGYTKYCKICGKELEWNNKGGYCEECASY